MAVLPFANANASVCPFGDVYKSGHGSPPYCECEEAPECNDCPSGQVFKSGHGTHPNCECKCEPCSYGDGFKPGHGNPPYCECETPSLPPESNLCCSGSKCAQYCTKKCQVSNWAIIDGADCTPLLNSCWSGVNHSPGWNSGSKKYTCPENPCCTGPDCYQYCSKTCSGSIFTNQVVDTGNCTPRCLSPTQAAALTPNFISCP